MIPRRDRPVIAGAAILLLLPAMGAALCSFVAFHVLEEHADQALQDIFKNSDKLAAEASSGQLTAGILGLLVVGGIVGATVIWFFTGLLWMIGIILLLILRELREINELR